MIQLSSQHALIIDRSGQHRTFGFAEVESELRRCFRECGFVEDWVAEHIILVLEEQLLQRRQSSAEIRESDVDRMLVDILVAAGYGDVARIFERRRGMDPLDDLASALAPWDVARVREVVLSRLPVSGEDVATELAERVAGVLRQSRFSRVSDALIAELGLHLLCSGRLEGGHPAADSPCLYPPDHWLGTPAFSRSVFASSGVVRVRPVSRIFPRACLDVYLLRLGETLGPGLLTELIVLPRIWSLCRELPGLLATVREALVAYDSSCSEAPCHTVVHGLERLLESRLMPLSPRSRRALAEDIQAHFRGDAVGRTSFDVILTFR